MAHKKTYSNQPLNSQSTSGVKNPGSDKAAVDEYRKKITEIAVKNPKKLATVLTEWLKHASKNKSNKKAG